MIERDAAKGVNKMAKVKNAEEATEGTNETPAEETFSAKDLATLCGVDGKAFRRWLRSTTDRRANKGGRWKFSATERDQMVEAFKARNNKPAEATEAKS